MYEFYRKGVMVLTPLCIIGIVIFGKIYIGDLNGSKKSQPAVTTVAPTANAAVKSESEEENIVYDQDDLDFDIGVDNNSTTQTEKAHVQETQPPVSEKPNNTYVAPSQKVEVTPYHDKKDDNNSVTSVAPVISEKPYEPVHSSGKDDETNTEKPVEGIPSTVVPTQTEPVKETEPVSTEPADVSEPEDGQ